MPLCNQCETFRFHMNFEDIFIVSFFFLLEESRDEGNFIFLFFVIFCAVWPLVDNILD